MVIVIDLKGMTINEAEKALAPYGIKRVRCSSVDGIVGMGTADFRADRVNVDIVGGRITEVHGRG